MLNCLGVEEIRLRLHTSKRKKCSICTVSYTHLDDFTIHMISIGEISGNLDEVMLSLADYYQRMDEMSNQLRQALSLSLIHIYTESPDLSDRLVWKHLL